MSQVIGIIYRTTNLVNGRMYIGKHLVGKEYDGSFDGYLGSGTLLKRAIKYYGEENFERTTLKECYSVKDLEESEEYYLMKYNCAENPLYYNLINTCHLGGRKSGYHHTEGTKRLIGLHSGSSRKGKPLTESQKLKISKYLRSPENRQRQSALMKGTITINNGTLEKRVTPTELDEYLEQGWTKGRLNSEVSPIFKDYWKGKKQSEEMVQKRAESLTGRVALFKGDKFVRVSPKDIDSYISEGWSVGMPESFSEMRSKDVSGKVHIYKGEEQKFIYPDELDAYFSDGWLRGLPPSQRKKLSKSKLGENNPACRDDVKAKISKANSGRIWVQNGLDRFYIYPEELDKYLSEGYVRGKKLKKLQETKED